MCPWYVIPSPIAIVSTEQHRGKKLSQFRARFLSFAMPYRHQMLNWAIKMAFMAAAVVEFSGRRYSGRVFRQRWPCRARATIILGTHANKPPSEMREFNSIRVHQRLSAADSAFLALLAILGGSNSSPGFPARPV
jgi:hypothetical protein